MSVKSGNSGRSRQRTIERYIETNVDCKKHSNVNFDDGCKSRSSPSCQQKNSVVRLHCNTGSKTGDDSWQFVSSNQDQKLKEHKAEVHRLAEFVCGDWSEHISSSGKRYYYNCKTEISQWEKPKEWSDELSVRSGSDCFPSKQAVEEKLESFQHDSDDSSCNGLHRKAVNHHSCVAEASCSSVSGKYQIDAKRSTASPSRMEISSSSSNLKAESCVAGSVIKSRFDPTPASGVVCASYQLNGSRTSLPAKEIRSVAEEDMDISPGSTPTEESLHEKSFDSGLFNSRQSSSIANESSAGLSHVTATSTLNSNLVYADRGGSSDKSAFLRTLMSLQHVLSNVSPSDGSSLTRSMPPSALSVLASLPSLVSQLQEAEHGAMSSSDLDHKRGVNHQHVMQQVITMLQKLQQALVAQQQQQQQRQLQELLVQLLNMHTVTPVELYLQNLTNANSSESALCKSGKLESPYSPPDSDGTPLGSPEDSGIPASDHGKSVHDMVKCNESPSSNGHNGGPLAFQSSSVSPSRTVDENQGLAGGSGSVLLVHSSSGLVGTSHLAAVNRKHPDSISLTPTLTQYVNSQLVSHLSGWPTDVVERQINCYYEESNSISSLQCSQISVDLKQARSLVRLNEIQTTLQEQRLFLQFGVTTLNSNCFFKLCHDRVAVEGIGAILLGGLLIPEVVCAHIVAQLVVSWKRVVA